MSIAEEWSARLEQRVSRGCSDFDRLFHQVQILTNAVDAPENVRRALGSPGGEFVGL